MTTTAVQNKSAITLQGSADIVCEYLDYGINSILYQRGIYPPDEFEPTKIENYGLTVHLTQNKKTREFLENTLRQVKHWLIERAVNKISLVIKNVKNGETMERWDFVVQYEGNANQEGEQTTQKPVKQIRNEIRDIMIQIAASVSYLPLHDCLCSFDIQIHTKEDVKLPELWADTELAHIKNAQSVQMRSFSTNIHKMETLVTYKTDD